MQHQNFYLVPNTAKWNILLLLCWISPCILNSTKLGYCTMLCNFGISFWYRTQPSLTFCSCYVKFHHAFLNSTKLGYCTMLCNFKISILYRKQPCGTFCCWYAEFHHAFKKYTNLGYCTVLCFYLVENTTQLLLNDGRFSEIPSNHQVTDRAISREAIASKNI